MFKTFALSFRLRNSYKTNGIIWALKGIPLIRNILPSSLYASRGLKIFANILSGIEEFFMAFLGKLIYLLIVMAAALSMPAAPGSCFAHILIFTTVIGGLLNTQIFEPGRDKFYAVFLMRMDARRYVLTEYLYFMLKMLIGLTIFSLFFGSRAGAAVMTCLAVPVFVICVKLCFTAYTLKSCLKTDSAYNENKPKPPVWILAAVLLALAAVPYAGYVLPEAALPVLAAIMLIPAVFSGRYISGFSSYRRIYKELLHVQDFTAGKSITGTTGAAQQLALQKKISADMSRTSSKSGYKYFNELFMKRHAKILTRLAKRITAVTVIFFTAAAAALRIFPSANTDVNEILMTYLPYFLFVMYILNCGRTITQAMFMNCDHSMLAYRFYRQPKVILTLFIERLKYVILINLMPASVIALGLPMLLYLTGGTAEPLNYAVLFISIMTMSVFFSVHSMVLYYLFQPYNVNLESRSVVYSIVNWVTYIICWLGIQVHLPTLWFGSAVSAFCIIYAAAAFVLAYRLAPRTFKLRA